METALVKGSITEAGSLVSHNERSHFGLRPPSIRLLFAFLGGQSVIWRVFVNFREQLQEMKAVPLVFKSAYPEGE